MKTASKNRILYFNKSVLPPPSGIILVSLLEHVGTPQQKFKKKSMGFPGERVFTEERTHIPAHALPINQHKYRFSSSQSMLTKWTSFRVPNCLPSRLERDLCAPGTLDSEHRNACLTRYTYSSRAYSVYVGLWRSLPSLRY